MHKGGTMAHHGDTLLSAFPTLLQAAHSIYLYKDPAVPGHLEHVMMASPFWQALEAPAAEAAAANADAVAAYEAAREAASVQLPLFATAVLLKA